MVNMITAMFLYGLFCVSAPFRCAGAHGSGARREGEVPPAMLYLESLTSPALTPCQVIGFSPAGVLVWGV